MGKADPCHPKGKHYTERELMLHRNESVKNSRECLKEATKEDIEKLFADDEVVVFDGGTVGENGGIKIDGMTKALEEMAKHLPKITQSKKCYDASDGDDLLPDGTSRKIKII